MNTKINKSVVISSLLWKLLERTGTQGVQFIVQILLARLLLPEEYGTISIVMVFILISNVFVQKGFNTSLVQKKDADEIDFSSVLYLSVFVALLCYICIYCLAPYIANFYKQPILASVLRVLAITLFIGAFNSVQNAYISKYMLFKKLFSSSLLAAVISGFVGIVAAYRGFGVWALVLQQLTNQFSVTVILWSSVKWRPQMVFSLSRIKGLFKYGYKLLISSLIDTLYKELNTLIIGRLYTPNMLGMYNRGQQFPQLIVSNINGSIQSVMLPTLSVYQDDRKRMKEVMRRAIVTSSFFIFPMMVGMAVVANSLVEILLTKKWLSAVPFLQIACFTFALWPIHTVNLQAINALGRSDIFLKLEIIKKIIGIVVLCISLPFGIYAIAIGGVINGILATFINSYPNKQLLDYSYKEQLLDIIPSLFISIIMGCIIYSFSLFKFSTLSTLSIQITVGIFVYLSLAKIFRLESLSYVLDTLKDIKKTKTISVNN